MISFVYECQIINNLMFVKSGKKDILSCYEIGFERFKTEAAMLQK